MKAVKAALIVAALIMTSFVIIPGHNLIVEASDSKEVTTKKEGKEVKAKEAIVRKYDLSESEQQLAYDQLFKIGLNEIESYSTNGGNYPGAPIEKAFDDKFQSHWETGKANTKNFTNEVEVLFKETVSLDRIVYAARRDAGGKGFAKQFEIQASETESGDDFKVVATGSYDGSTMDAIEINFPETKFKRFKFVFHKAIGDWASASEFRFFKKDTVKDQMESLFTDNTFSKVNSKYATEEALAQLENAAKGHLYWDTYKVWLEDARALIKNDFTPTKSATVRTFDDFEHKQYGEKFRMDYDNIKSIRNNGGHWAQQVIAHAIDGKPDTYWETNKGNNANFNNEVEVEFKNPEIISSIVYGARADRKGFAEEAEIYVSQTSRGDTYQLLTTAKHQSINGFVRAEFEPTMFKRVKFKYKKSNQNWATLSELAFYKEDIVLNKVNRLFTDQTMSEVSKEFNTVKKLTALEDEMKKHPLYDQYKDQFGIAKSLLNGEIETEGTIVTAEQHGNMDAHASNNLKVDFGNNLQPTGFAARKGEVVTIYVDAESNGPLPKIAFAQQEGHWSSWFKEYQLKVGKNVFIVPQVGDPGKIVNPTIPGGSIYIVNPYTPEQQGKAPKLRFEGATQIPFATKDTDVEEFKKFLVDYKKKIDEDIKKHPKVEDREVLDIYEFVSDHIFWTGTATGAYDAYITRGFSPLETIDSYNVFMGNVLDFFGLDGRNDKNDRKKIRENIRLAQPFGYMYSFVNHIGVQKDVMSGLLIPHNVSKPGWGISHEIGHSFDIGARTYAEVTTNVVAQYISALYGVPDMRIPFEGNIYKKVLDENYDGYTENLGSGGYAVYWQLEMYRPGYWGKLDSLYRERNVKVSNDADKQKYLVEFSSEALELDLSEHFERHGFKVTDETKKITGKYNKPKHKTWYLNTSASVYEGNGIQIDEIAIDLDVTPNKEKSTNTIRMDVDEKYSKDILGFEIIRDGKIIGFTGKNTFVDEKIDVNQNYTYEIIAYDMKLKPLKAVNVHSKKPKLSVENQLTLKLRSAFNPLDYAIATSDDGQDISEKITVKSNDVNVLKKGTYSVVYEVEHNGIKETKTTDVMVTSDYIYASDIKEVSFKTDWRTLQKDKSTLGETIRLLRQGMEVPYSKGLGIHANSEVIYDIAEEDYEYFESYIGIDQSVKGKNSSATFEVWVDDKKEYSSKVFGSADSHQFIRVPVENAKQVKLVTTDAKQNGNASDHTVWGSAKFTINSSKPILEIPKDLSTKVGVPVDLNGSFNAFDPEDGDLTNQVKITGQDKVNFEQAGKYKITYTVDDSDGNRVHKQRTIHVVDMDNTKYLSDYEWESTHNSHTAPKKDKNANGNRLTLTNKNGNPIGYEKGIGAHANSTIVYDLTKINAAYLSSNIGVERTMYNSVASIVFQVFVDGEERYNSGLMRSKDPQKYFEVDLSGGKELKIVVSDGGNGIGSDHAAWGDAKLHFSGDEQYNTVVDSVYSNHTTVTGIAKPNTVVSILNEQKEQIGQGQVNKDGEFDVAIKKQQAGTELTIVVKDQDGKEIDQKIIEVKQAIIDVTKLDALIAEAKDLATDETYTEESLSVLRKQIEQAEEIAKEAKSDEEVEQAIDELQQAIDGLKKIENPEIDTTELESLIKQAKVLQAEDYTANSFEKLEEAIRTAESTVQQPQSQQNVNDAIDELQQAIDCLEKAENPSPEPEPDPDPDPEPEPGPGPNPEPEPEIDVSALVKLIAFAETYDKTQYTTDSFAKVEEAIRTAKLIVANPESQESVEQSYAQLQTAIEGLIRVEEPTPEPEIDVSALQQLIDQAKVYSADQYTTDTFETLQNAIRHGQIVVQNPESQDQVANAIRQLQTAIQGLVHVEPSTPEEIDRSELEGLLTHAKTYKQSDYTAQSYAGLQLAIQAGESALLNAVTQNDIIEAIDQLSKAIIALEKESPPLPEPELNKSELEKMIAHAKTYEESAYTAESFKHLQQVIQNAITTLGNATTQQEIIKAINQLTNAIMQLEKSQPVMPQLDTKQLEKLIEQAKAYRKDDYTEATFNALQEAIRQAEFTVGNATSEKEITDAIAKLQLSIDQLEEMPTPNPAVKPEVKPEPKPEVKPEVEPEAKPEVKPEPKSKVKSEQSTKENTSEATKNVEQNTTVESTVKPNEETDQPSSETPKNEQVEEQQMSSGNDAVLSKTSTNKYILLVIGILLILIAMILFVRKQKTKD